MSSTYEQHETNSRLLATLKLKYGINNIDELYKFLDKAKMDNNPATQNENTDLNYVIHKIKKDEHYKLIRICCCGYDKGKKLQIFKYQTLIDELDNLYRIQKHIISIRDDENYDTILELMDRYIFIKDYLKRINECGKINNHISQTKIFRENTDPHSYSQHHSQIESYLQLIDAGLKGHSIILNIENAEGFDKFNHQTQKQEFQRYSTEESNEVKKKNEAITYCINNIEVFARKVEEILELKRKLIVL